ncbi:phosphotransferase [Mycolicibacterium sp.]|uniref:phosphotransferase n=1 Tax=Mycolicibacterium sp. TaxID=2320850 RepID=UPI003D0B2A48
MSAPRAPQPIPPVVAALAGDRPVTAVWVNELGGVTFAIGTAPPTEYVKSYPGEFAHLLAAEVPRLRWARAYTPVPAVLGAGPGWLHTAAVPGRSAVDPLWSEHPETAAAAIGAGLRGLHDALPVPDCPFGPPSWVGAAAPPDRLVVCHGDACAPNTLMADDGSCAGHVDLGDLGVADRWADLAVATMSLDWNFPVAGDGSSAWEAVLLDAYGVAPDRDRIAVYRALWNDEPVAPG